MSTPPAINPSKISEPAFYAATGCFFTLALIVAVSRVVARIRNDHRLYLDDAFFFLATTCLVAGTTLVFVLMPFLYLSQEIQAGKALPPADFLQQVIHNEKIQDATTVVLGVTVFSVKFSFLCFFLHLLHLQQKMMWYWWFVCAITVPSAFIFVFSDFISCDYFDERIIEFCSSASANLRVHRVLVATAVIDIITDALLISIPIVLLWNVQITLHRKLVLCGVLCLSVLMIIIAIIRVADGELSNGAVDSIWLIFWLEVEACVAVIVVSMSAFRALFVAQKKASRHRREGSHQNQGSSGMLSWTATGARFWNSKGRLDKSLPSLPSTVHGGNRTGVYPSIDDTRSDLQYGGMELPLAGKGSGTMRPPPSEEKIGQNRPSSESFV